MIIRIDKYFFEVKHNIESLTKSLSVNLDKQNTITKPVYTHIGRYEETISFNAKILLYDKSEFLGFENLIKKAKPLRVDALDLVNFKYIFIQKYNITSGTFVKSIFFGTEYYTKELQIEGVILQEDYKEALERGMF
ncbi:hypothetical protein [Campylobacter sputorum]|uniref:hypothetical protein n=1 Tax=Campylobacter sputorum TaxID=206 RepID=UPI00068AB776|nr:hypothetical protein [Campylobacter sputorum]